MPRLFLEHPDLFGRPGEVRWRQPTSADEYIGLRAAELQHHLSLVVADRARSSGEPNGRLEERSGLAAGRLSKLLRGHGQMTFRDVMALEGALGPVLAVLDYQQVHIEDEVLRERFASEAM